MDNLDYLSTGRIEVSKIMLSIDRESKSFTSSDVLIFCVKLAILLLITCASLFLIESSQFWKIGVGEILLGAMFAHAVELQHQVLHGTAFKSKKLSHIVGFFLGTPMMISYSRYKALHMIHHRYLGTDRDTEFFTYAASGKLTVLSLMKSAFNVRRWIKALRDMLYSWSMNSKFDEVITRHTVHADIRNEYRAMSLILLMVLLSSVMINKNLVVLFWMLPMIIGEVIHFMIELPEHLFCDRSTDVFSNTRTIRGSLFSFWLTNGNNFHVEHHARMGVPINKLPKLHGRLHSFTKNYRDSYWRFYCDVIKDTLKRKSNT